MRTKMLRLTALLVLLTFALPAAFFVHAEGDSAMPESGLVEETVGEVEFDLGSIEADVATEIAAPEEASETAAQGTGDESAPAEESGQDPETPEASASPEPQVTVAPTATPAEPEKPAYFSAALKTKTIKLKKDTSKTVYIGIPYKITVKGGTVKSFKTSAKKVATVSKDGTLKQKKAGKANITVKTKAGKKYVLKLKVKAAPAPGDVKVSSSKTKFKLSWSAAKYATGYMVETSKDGKKWEEFKAASSDKLKMTVTKAVTGTTWFRVKSILGDHFGGVSDVVSVLTPVTDAKVFLEESYNYGPTNRMNVTWTASPGATKYKVYRATLPSKKYKLVDTTKKTYYADTLSPTKLYSYKIKPVWGKLTDLPACDPVNLWTGMQSNVKPPKDLTSSTGIILVVNKQAQVVTAYIKDSKGKYTLPLRHMICSTGRTYERTRNGTYTLLSKKGEWYTYPGPSGDTIRWPSVYRGSYYFHSPLYNKNHTIRVSTVRRLGDRASAGCVRLKSNDAQWIYDNCPVGTAVYICDGSKKDKLKEALKPKTVKVSGF